jgi:predicted amidohydrolase YtcJ
MLIRRAELEEGTIADVRVERGRISAIGDLAAAPGEQLIEATSGLLLPGLHDHHIHVAALAASLTSVRCGPPEVDDAEGLQAALNPPGDGWLRGIGYHESVAGMLDAATLDAINPNRPLRIQHRSGRMWFFNSVGLETILAKGPPPPGLEREGDRFTGRLFDEDRWLRTALASEPPFFAQVGTLLARAGVTGLTDMSVGNDLAMARHFASEKASSALPQRLLLAGTLELADWDGEADVRIGPAKLHLHEAQLPTIGDALDFIGEAHDQARAVAIHCVTETELVFALALLRGAGAEPGDRIEHASVAPDSAIAEIAELRLAVVSQPHFIAERGDLYRRDVEARDQPLLYRLRAFLDASITLAGGSDAPFGSADPWEAMAAAVSRRTAAGEAVAVAEALTPEEALDLYLREPEALHRRRSIRVGAPADLCLLDRSWAQARSALSCDLVRTTIVNGRIIHDRVDQPPF